MLILVLAGFATLVYFVVGEQLARQLNYDIRVRALQASRTLRAVSGGYQYRTITPLDLPAALPQLDEGLYAQVVGPRGDVLATSRTMPEPLPIPPETLREALAG